MLMSQLQTNPPSKKQALAKLFLLISLLAVFAGGYFFGLAGNRYQQEVDLTQFWQVYRIVKQRYVNEVDPQKAAEGAAAGLVESLGDPFSAYLAPSQKRNLDEELRGEFEGIGAELTQKDQLITVVAPLADSPAEAAGLKASDIILKVDDLSTDGLSLDEVVAKIRGPKDTVVKLTIARKNADKPIEISITRANIEVKSVTSRMIDNIGYLEITQFGDKTVESAQVAVNELAGKKPKAMIIDLRNNPGGYLNGVAPIAGLFLPPSVIVKEKYRDGKSDEIRSTAVPVMPETPLYVLVNGGSASASEILAGALQDYKRATLVGQKTFGKGSVQDLVTLKNGAALRITIAEWLTPNDRAINKVGIEPDVKVDGEKNETSDPILDKALELAKAK